MQASGESAWLTCQHAMEVRGAAGWVDMQECFEFSCTHEIIIMLMIMISWVVASCPSQLETIS